MRRANVLLYVCVGATVLMAQAPPAPPVVPMPAAPAPMPMTPLPSGPATHDKLSAPELAKLVQTCSGGAKISLDSQILACSALIQSEPAIPNPERALAYLRRGLAIFDKGHLEKAEADFSAALKLKGDDPLIWSARAKVRFYLDAFDGALADGAAAVKLKPDLADAYYHRGNAFTGKREFDFAVAEYTLAIKHNPNFAFAYADRGIAHLRKERFKEAIADIEKANALNGRRIPWAQAQLEEARAAMIALTMRQDVKQVALAKKKSMPVRRNVVVDENLKGGSGPVSGPQPVQRPITGPVITMAPQEPISAGANDLEGPSLSVRVALVIGNGRYQNVSPLRNAENDAADVASALQKAGYTVYGYPRLNMTRDEMIAAIKSFQAAAAQADTAVAWYAGHGQEFETGGALPTNWLIPVDYQTDDDVWDRGIALTRLMTAVTPARTLRLVVVDACRNSNLPSGKRGSRGFVVEERSDMMIVYSTRAGRMADDGPKEKRNSPFAEAFLEVLSQHPKVDVRQFFGGVTRGTFQRTKSQQPPQEPELIVRLQEIASLPLVP